MDKSHVGMASCFICGEPKHILLDRRLRDSLPRIACYDKEPCEKCKDFMKKGTIFISVKDGESGDNPYRTGGWIVLKQEAVDKLFKDKPPKIAFVEDTLWDNLGFPRGEVKSVPKD